MAFCGKQNSGYEPCLKTALNFLYAKFIENEFRRVFFFLRVHMCECRWSEG